MIAGNPHMPSAGSWNTLLNKIMRGRNPNYNFLSRGAKGQRSGEDHSD
jgi:hypothetical protein